MKRVLVFVAAVFLNSFFLTVHADTIDVTIRIGDDRRDEKVLYRENLIAIKKFILSKGMRGTYCNMYNNNPYYFMIDYQFYLDPDTGQGNINCDPKLSDFNHLVIHNRKSNLSIHVDFVEGQAVTISLPWPSGEVTISMLRELARNGVTAILQEMKLPKAK